MMAVYWRKQRYQVQGEGKRAGRECYLLEGSRSTPKSECIPTGDLDIFATWNGDIPEWQPNSSPKPWQELRRFSVDIETTGLNPETDRVIAIAGGAPGIGAFVAADADETKILRQLMATLRAVKPDILIGYNCYKFDLPFLIKRCELHGIKHPFTISDKPKRLTKAVVAGKPLEVWPIYYNANSLRGEAIERQVSVIDLYPLVVAHDNVTSQLESHTLKQAALGFGLRKTPRLELTVSEIHRLWETYLKEGIKESLEKILLYLNFDVEDTHLLAEFLLPQYYYQKILLPDLSLQQLTLTGTATKWNIVLKNHYRWEPEPDPQVPIEGGLMVVNPGLYRNCSKIDVSSLYPSVMLKYGVWTRKDKDRYGLGILQHLTRYRLELKRRAKSGDTEAGLMSGALKIFINSAYGFLGTPGMPFNDYVEFAKVPAYGREILKFMLHYLETNNAVIVEADTDGIIFSHPQPEALRDCLQRELPEGINIELEWTNTHVYCAKKKSYILFHPDGNIKANGIYKKRDKTKLEKIYPVEYLKRFLEGGLSEAETYHQELEKSLLSGNHPISELTITRSIRVNEKALLKLGKPGDTITFYQGESGATISGNYSPRHYLEKILEIRTEILKVLAIPPENSHAKPD
jgi:DNA polymerase I